MYTGILRLTFNLKVLESKIISNFCLSTTTRFKEVSYQLDASSSEEYYGSPSLSQSPNYCIFNGIYITKQHAMGFWNNLFVCSDTVDLEIIIFVL